MMDLAWSALIGMVFVVLMVPGSFWITDRTGSDFLGFLFFFVLSLVIYPVVLVLIMQ